MKVTFELPSPVVHRLRSHVPVGERSRFVAQLISAKLKGPNNAFERAAKKANTLRNVSHAMKDWEALNGHDD